MGSATYESSEFYGDYSIDRLIHRAHQYYVYDDERFTTPTLDTQLTSKNM